MNYLVEKILNHLKPKISLEDASDALNLHLRPYVFTCARNNTATSRGTDRTFMLQNAYETGRSSHGRNNQG